MKPSPDRRRLPPLNPLRAFEAAARHRSFTKAAEELFVTQGAISRSVKVLEDSFRLQLFNRTATGLELDEAGQLFARQLTDAFERISAATEVLLAGRGHAVVTVLAYTSFLIHWLMPRLPEFQLKHPDVEVRLISANDKVRMDRESIDLRVRYGHGRWPGTENTFLFADRLSPVCSPRLLDPAAGPYAPSILREHTLLHSSIRHRDWADWLEMVGEAGLQPRSDLFFDELSVVYQAACGGMGIAIGQEAYVRESLQSGLLVKPFEQELTRELGYYLCYSAESRHVPQIVSFREWLAGTFAEAS